jgi:hypothetical protein
MMLTNFDVQVIEAEARALDLIHELLSRSANKRGLPARAIATQTGLAIGYVNRLLKSSKLVLKRRPRHPHLWFADWNDISTEWRPVRRAGRPRKS